MSERDDQLKDLIQNGQISRAIEIVRGTKDYREGEEFVFTVLGEEKSMPELIEAVLEAFLGTRENRYRQHGYWVHSLSHFTKILWQRRMDGWIKKFNEAAFKGANELRDPNCSDRLVWDFRRHAKFDDHPADFALTPENLCWMNWGNGIDDAYIKARIEAGRFESEEAFLRWEIHQPLIYIGWDNDAQRSLIKIEGIRSRIQKIKELGGDISEFDGLERGLLTKQLIDLEQKLAIATHNRDRECLEKAIQKTRAALV